MAQPFRENNNLILGQVRNGVHRRVIDRVDAPERKQQPCRDDEETVADREGDDARDHGGWCSCIFDRYLLGFFLSAASQPAQHRKMTRSPMTKRVGVPMEPSGLF